MMRNQSLLPDNFSIAFSNWAAPKLPQSSVIEAVEKRRRRLISGGDQLPRSAPTRYL
ncbi:hypothetical protein LCGC14_0097160 [marine sediment metagenome]|uniref:Uncharacterized protein n=1 Tax=marine sediment metagenome TaxID=412755 RepID=A0A0F9VTR1_9ZZZZ